MLDLYQTDYVNLHASFRFNQLVKKSFGINTL